MGCYNTVIANCPNCGYEIDYQSKGGTCNLDIFNIDEVPIEDALYIQESSETCSNCGEVYKIVPYMQLGRIPMILIKL